MKRTRKQKLFILVSFIVLVGILVGVYTYLEPIITRYDNLAFDEGATSQVAAANKFKRSGYKQPPPSVSEPLPPASVNATFGDSFDAPYTVREDGDMSGSNNANWWVSSGAYLISASGVGSTVVGALPTFDPWRVAYSLSNSRDTGNGYYPQAIFRAVLRTQWQNSRQEVYFKVVGDNLIASPNRNASNGLLLFNRYQDAFNLYYTGVRVDGHAVIKKKVDGTYYTMAYKKIFDDIAYDAVTNSNVLPKDTWIGVRSEIMTKADHTVSVKMYVDTGKTGTWVLAAEAIDDGTQYGGAPFLSAGHGGMRTDFMDVLFDDFSIQDLPLQR